MQTSTWRNVVPNDFCDERELPLDETNSGQKTFLPEIKQTESNLLASDYNLFNSYFLLAINV